MAVELSYKVIGEGKPLIILHGLFGSLDNWMTFARNLAEHRKVYLVDQRNHGRSPHTDEFNYDVMAEDLRHFIEEHKLDRPDLIGHSMGGKTAMYLAVKYPEHFDRLIVIDIAPKAYPIHHDKIIEGLKALDLSKISSREEADAELEEYIPEPDVRMFLLKNLKRTGEGFEWKLNLKAIEENLDRIGEGLQEKRYTDKPVLFIRGSTSNYIKDKDIITTVSLFPNAEIKTIEGAGHWIHAEKPDELLKMVAKFLDISALY
ncbi:MAG: alpha/beta fold hydrolase [Candidatus Cyclobacteriaceae bacterium M2_1C_046]